MTRIKERGKSALEEIDKSAFKSLESFKKAGKFDGLKRHIKKKRGKQTVKTLKDWNFTAIEEWLDGATEQQLADKYCCSRSWISAIIRSDLGVEVAAQILNKIDTKTFRTQLKRLNGICFLNLKNALDPLTSTLDEKDRAKLTIETLKLNGIAEPSEHKFKFEHEFKKVGEAVGEVEKIVETTITDVTEEKINDITTKKVIEVALNE